VFAIGDVASVADRSGDELAMLSPPAMQGGRHVARTILADVGGEGAPRAPGPFHYRDKGILATIGRNAAVARTGRLELTGLPAWVAWSTVHLYYLVGHRNRLVVLGSWSIDYLKRDRPIRVIARADHDELSEGLATRTEHELARPDA
jgi:NADH dehydrogenase